MEPSQQTSLPESSFIDDTTKDVRTKLRELVQDSQMIIYRVLLVVTPLLIVGVFYEGYYNRYVFAFSLLAPPLVTLLVTDRIGSIYKKILAFCLVTFISYILILYNDSAGSEVGFLILPFFSCIEGLVMVGLSVLFSDFEAASRKLRIIIILFLTPILLTIYYAYANPLSLSLFLFIFSILYVLAHAIKNTKVITFLMGTLSLLLIFTLCSFFLLNLSSLDLF